MDLLNFFLIFTKVCILLENKEKKFGVRGTLTVVRLFETVTGLKEYLVQRSGEELKPATTGKDFTLGYFGKGNNKFTIRTSTGRGYIIGERGDSYIVGGPTFT